MSSTQGPWRVISPIRDTWYRWRLDGAEIFVLNRDEEWRWAAKPRNSDGIVSDFGGPEMVEGPGALETQIVVAPPGPMSLRPFTVSLPFVIEVRNSVSIQRGSEAEFLIDLPVSFRLQGKGGLELFQPNTILLRKTWFGDTSAGVLCFFWPTDLRPATARPFGALVRCRVLVRNLSKMTLELHQFAVYTEVLSLWDQGDTLASDIVLLEGLPDGTLRMGIIPDEAARKGSLLYEAPVGQTEQLIKRGVSFLRSITGIS